MSEEIMRLTENDTDEAIALLNRTFSLGHHRDEDFRKSLPKMCRPDQMYKHIGLRRDGKLCAVLGVYPLPTMVAGEKLMFSTMGNVATAPEEQGKGYMSRLLDVAMDELEKIGADASRLGGKRERYNRYGYEECGTLFNFSLNESHLEALAPFGKGVTSRIMSIVSPEILDQIDEAQRIYARNPFRVLRDTPLDFWQTLIAWECTPIAYYSASGRMIGYLCITPNGQKVSEYAAVTVDDLKAMLACALAEKRSLSIPVMPHRVDDIMFLSSLAKPSVSLPSMFFIRHWDRVITAMLGLEATYMALPDADFTFAIDGTAYRLTVREGQPLCEKLGPDDGSAPLKLDRVTAARVIFGHPRPEERPDIALPETAGLILPIPLSWDTQDRV